MSSRIPSSRPPFSGRRRKSGRAPDAEDVVQTGPGEVWFSNGDYGAGNFKQHTLDGSGVYRYGPGDLVLQSYEGELVDGVSHGPGQLLYRNGDRYAGEFAEDEPDGVGTLRRVDGRVFRGRFFGGAQVRSAPRGVPHAWSFRS